MDGSHRTTMTQRVGFLLSLVEAGLFALSAVLHAGLEVDLLGRALTLPFNVYATAAEATASLALLLALVLPGRRGARAGRVVAAQLFAALVLVVGQVALAYGVDRPTAGYAISRTLLLALVITSIALVAWPPAPSAAPLPPARAAPPARPAPSPRVGAPPQAVPPR